MRKLTVTLVALLGILVPTGPLFASDSGYQTNRPPTGGEGGAVYLVGSHCAGHANALASSYANAQVLSVEENGSTCTIVIRVNDNDGNPPRIIKKTISD